MVSAIIVFYMTKNSSHSVSFIIIESTTSTQKSDLEYDI